MDSYFQVLKLRAQLFLSALEDLSEQRKQELIDLIAASNFNHQVDDPSSFYPSINHALFTFNN